MNLVNRVKKRRIEVTASYFNLLFGESFEWDKLNLFAYHIKFTSLKVILKGVGLGTYRIKRIFPFHPLHITQLFVAHH